MINNNEKNNNENRLSLYIDSLNEEKKPREHEVQIDESEMESLFQTVRLVRSLKEPRLPDEKYNERLSSDINKKIFKDKSSSKVRKRWFMGMASSAAAVALIITLNAVNPIGRTNVVYAMEQAFSDVKAYHGVLEIVEISAEGKSTIQSKEEVWADKNGHYYVKNLEGSQNGLLTINDGQKKWQVQPTQREVDVFPAFPDPYSFTFELGKEINSVKDAVKTKVIGDDKIAGRATSIIEVTPQGGSAYRIWIDKETKLPLQKQSAMQNSLQYIARYISVDFTEVVPKELLSYNVPKGFKEINTNPEQVVNSIEEAKEIVGFAPTLPKNISSFYKNSITIINETKIVKMNFASQDNEKRVSILQKKVSDQLKPSSIAVLGKVNNNVAEIQSPIQDTAGVLLGGGAYAGMTGISSVRWQQDGFEYAVVGNTSLDELTLFIKALTNGTVELSSKDQQSLGNPQVKVPFDLKAEEGDQKSVDAGHSPWKLDPAFVAQVFVSLKISPEGIQGDYPIDYNQFKIVQNNGKEAVIEVGGEKTPISKVYLKRLIRQDSTGIWTVVGYDPK